MTSASKRLGRPPSGMRPGEKVSQYRQVSVRVPPDIDRLLKSLSSRTGEAQWRVVSRALRAYARQLRHG